MSNPVSGPSFSAPVNPPMDSSTVRNAPTPPIVESDIKSMASESNGNCLCNPFTYLFNKIKSFLNWLFPSLFSAPIDQQQLQNRIQKGQEIVSRHLKESLFASSAYALDPSRYATIVKVIYNGEEEGYMVDQSLANPKAFLEEKVEQFLTKHATQTAGRFEIQTTFVYYENTKKDRLTGQVKEEVIHAKACSAVAFPEGAIVVARPYDLFLEYTKMEDERQIIRFSEFIRETFAKCVNQGPDSVFPSGTHEGSTGSCSELLRNAIRALDPRS